MEKSTAPVARYSTRPVGELLRAVRTDSLSRHPPQADATIKNHQGRCRRGRHAAADEAGRRP